MGWSTAFTRLFGVELPILGAPMAGVSGGLLAAETCRAGALGFIAAGTVDDEEQLSKEIEIFRRHQEQAPLSLGFLTFGACPNDGVDLSKLERVLQTHRPANVQFFAPALLPHNDNPHLTLAKSYGAKVFCQVGTVEEAREALKTAGLVDVLIAQGSEAGGHGRRRELGNGVFGLASRVASISSSSSGGGVPVLAAGGMVNGKSLLSALAMGCDGIVLGTRLWASREGLGRDSAKQLLIAAEPDDCLRTTVIDQIMNSYAEHPWPYPFDSVGVLRNVLINEWDGRPREELEAQIAELARDFQKARQDGDTNICHVYAGEGVGDIISIEPAFDVIRHIDEAAKEAYLQLQHVVFEGSHDVDDDDAIDDDNGRSALR